MLVEDREWRGVGGRELGREGGEKWAEWDGSEAIVGGGEEGREDGSGGRDEKVGTEGEPEDRSKGGGSGL